MVGVPVPAVCSSAILHFCHQRVLSEGVVIMALAKFCLFVSTLIYCRSVLLHPHRTEYHDLNNMMERTAKVKGWLALQFATFVCIIGTHACVHIFSFFQTTECPQMTTPSSHMNGRSPLLRECSRTDSSGAREIGELNIPLAVGVSNTWLLFWLLLAFWVNLIPGAVPSCVGVDSSLSALGENLKVRKRWVELICLFLKWLGRQKRERTRGLNLYNNIISLFAYL